MPNVGVILSFSICIRMKALALIGMLTNRLTLWLRQHTQPLTRVRIWSLAMADVWDESVLPAALAILRNGGPHIARHENRAPIGPGHVARRRAGHLGHALVKLKNIQIFLKLV